MQNHLSHHDHVCAPLYCCLPQSFLFLFYMRRKQFNSSLQIIQGVMMKLARAFGVLSLRKHETHWISWINAWIKIHTIILQESPHTRTQNAVATLRRNLRRRFYLQANAFNLGVHKGGVTMASARITFCNMSLCPCFITSRGSSMKTIPCLWFGPVWW